MIWILFIFTLFLSSCEQKPQERHYKEIIIEAPLENNSAVNNAFSWVTPEGWKQESPEGMRLASFHLLSDAKAMDCSIVSLGGMAGGLEDNLGRWLGQIGLQDSEDNLKQLITSDQILKTKDGFEAKVFDFTDLQSRRNPSDKSMLVAIIVTNDTTIFVKMTGSIESVKQNKDNFLKLVGSVVRK